MEGVQFSFTGVISGTRIIIRTLFQAYQSEIFSVGILYPTKLVKRILEEMLPSQILLGVSNFYS